MTEIIIQLLLALIDMVGAGINQETDQPHVHGKPIDHPDYPPLEHADRVAAIYALIDQRKLDQATSGHSP